MLSYEANNERQRSWLVVAFGEFARAMLSHEANNERQQSWLVVAFGEFARAKLQKHSETSKFFAANVMFFYPSPTMAKGVNSNHRSSRLVSF